MLLINAKNQYSRKLPEMHIWNKSVVLSLFAIVTYGIQYFKSLVDKFWQCQLKYLKKGTIKNHGIMQAYFI